MALTTVSLEKVKRDIIAILNSNGVEAEEVAYCAANIVYRRGYASYVYSHDLASLEAKIKDFITSEEYSKSKSKIYVWSSYEGQYRYVYLGYFLPKSKDGLVQMVILAVNVAQA